MKLLTISVAAYNVEKFIRETLESLNDERVLDDIEVLVIDDGSKDDTVNIAREYSAAYPDTFRVIRKENGGHGSTINRGIQEATGKYFRVLDGDDYVDQENFVTFISSLAGIDSDMVISDYRCVDSNGRVYVDPYIIRHGQNSFELLQDGREYGLQNEDIPAYAISIHSLVVKTELLQQNHVHITEHCFYVDVEYVVWSMALSQSLTYVDLPVYMYRKDQLTNSVNKSSMVKNINMQETVACQLTRMYQNFADNNMPSQKLSLVRARVIGSVSAVIRTYLLMDNSTKRTKKFAYQIRSISPLLWDISATEDRFMRYVQYGNFVLLPLIQCAYKAYLRFR